MRITYLGHSAIRLEAGGAAILVDPFVTGNKLAEAAGLGEADLDADYILLTHAHSDHLGDTVAIARRTAAVVVGQHEVGEYLGREHGITNSHGMNVGGSRSFPWGRVTQTYARHSSSFPDGTYGGLAVGYIIEAEGKTIYHSGDTGAFAEMAWIGDDYSLDAAFLPIGDNYTMGPRDALRAVRMLRPALVVPIHYNTFPVIETDPQEFAKAVAAAGFQARVMSAGESHEL